MSIWRQSDLFKYSSFQPSRKNAPSCVISQIDNPFAAIVIAEV